MESVKLTLPEHPAEPEDDCCGLLKRAQAGDTSSFERLLILHERRLFRTALRLLGHVEDAQDALQEVFYRFYKYLPRFDPSRKLDPWLYKMTVNVCHDVARKRARINPPVLLPYPVPAAPTTATTDWEDRKELLAKALRSLAEKERAAIVLRDIEGFSTSEVAVILGSSETTIRSQICRARIKLKLFCDAILRSES